LIYNSSKIQKISSGGTNMKGFIINHPIVPQATTLVPLDATPF
jgi:hypothetical protein